MRVSTGTSQKPEVLQTRNIWGTIPETFDHETSHSAKTGVVIYLREVDKWIKETLVSF
jgi:hypothetical protein